MPPKVEAVILAALLVGAYILLENSRRIDVSPSDDDRVSVTAIPTCQSTQQTRRYSIMRAIAAEAEGAALPSDGPSIEAADSCTSARDYSAVATNANSAIP